MTHYLYRTAREAPNANLKPRAKPAAVSRHEIGRLRRYSDELCIWGLCHRTHCRRARACRHDPRDCLRCYEDIVPQSARAFFYHIQEAEEFGIPIDAIEEDLEDEIKDMVSWYQAMDAAHRPKRKR